jgi:hypothetical protein
MKMEGTRYRRLRRTCVAIRAEPDTVGRRPSFRGMSATDSEHAPKSGRIPVGISGRVPSEWVADLRRNQWPRWVEIRRPTTERSGGGAESSSSLVEVLEECSASHSSVGLHTTPALDLSSRQRSSHPSLRSLIRYPSFAGGQSVSLSRQARSLHHSGRGLLFRCWVSRRDRTGLASQLEADQRTAVRVSSVGSLSGSCRALPQHVVPQLFGVGTHGR